MYGLSSDPRTNRANGLFGLMFGLLFLAIGVYVFATMTADMGVIMIAVALLVTLFNGYRVFNSGPEEEKFDPKKLEDYSPEIQLLIIDHLKAEGHIDEKEYSSRRSAIAKKL